MFICKDRLEQAKKAFAEGNAGPCIISGDRVVLLALSLEVEYHKVRNNCPDKSRWKPIKQWELTIIAEGEDMGFTLNSISDIESLEQYVVRGLELIRNIITIKFNQKIGRLTKLLEGNKYASK